MRSNQTHDSNLCFFKLLFCFVPENDSTKVVSKQSEHIPCLSQKHDVLFTTLRHVLVNQSRDDPPHVIEYRIFQKRHFVFRDWMAPTTINGLWRMKFNNFIMSLPTAISQRGT